jgi:chlorobactene glucosyltransferase
MEAGVSVYFGLALLALAAMMTLAALNSVTFPRLRPATPSSRPTVSILIPARNEEATIDHTLAAHAASVAGTSAVCEILVLDDLSTDSTAKRIATLEAEHPSIRLISGEPLPEGWLGKNWACHQLARQSKGDVLVFTDADVAWLPLALSGVLHQLDRLPVDLLTVWPTQRTDSWAERLVVPMMMFAICAYLPEIAVRKTGFASLAAANGQCMVFRRAAYERIGGHERVRGEIVEDVALARLIKRAGLRLGMVLGDGQISCRMYRGWEEVLRGYGKNILAGHGGHPLLLLLSAVVHLALFLGPWVWMGASLAIGAWADWWQPLLLAALGLTARQLTALTTREKSGASWLLPVSVMLMTWIAGQALWSQFRYGGPEWKGRRIHSTPRGRAP